MKGKEQWDWTPGRKVVADLGKWKEEFEFIEEPMASPNGEKVAAVVKTPDEERSVCVNGEQWESAFEKIWFLRFAPDGRLVCIVSDTGEWTVAIDGETWENRFAYVWNLRFTEDGSRIIAAAQNDGKYLAVNNDEPWKHDFMFMTDLASSDDGLHSAGVVQVVPFSEGDIHTFRQGCYTAAVDGKAWDSKFMNVWEPVFSPSGKRVAAQVRISNYEYTIATDGMPWSRNFGCVWKPVFHPKGDSVTAPVRVAGAWHLAKDGEIIWNRKFVQLWHHAYSPDMQKIAAIVSPKFGIWTVAVNGIPWKNTVDEYITDMVFSPRQNRLACVGKNRGKYYVLADDNIWQEDFDMAWVPVFSPDGENLAAKVERNKRFTLIVNGKLLKTSYDALWDPIFSPDGKHILIRGIVNDSGNKQLYFREVVPVNQI
ncbi:MAG: WD40 repeat domain-containing protein [Desulfobacterales bacterium]